MSAGIEQIAAALPGYEIGTELGRGGWGVVLAGRHRLLGKDVAIKQLPPAFAVDPSVRARFVAEARILASLDHPHIVPVFDYVESEGLCLLVMENLPGGTLWSRFIGDGVTPETACAVILAACAGLHIAHQRGILHRDVKPENLMFSGNGAVKVTDFGIAKVMGGNETMATRAGEVIGTPAYMAPEQAQAGEVGPATDVYAIGTVLYELLSGHLPFAEDGDALSVLYRHVNEEPTPLGQVAPAVPAEIAAVVMRTLAKRPADRYPSAEAMGVALADAATAAWGPGWPELRGHQAVMGSAAIVAATERTSIAPGGGLPVPTSTRAVTSASVSGPLRATTSVRRGGAAPVESGPGEFRPMGEVLRRPALPIALVARAAGLVLLAAIVALLGIGSPSHGGNIPAGAVQVAGADVERGTIRVDLDDDVLVTGPGNGGSLPDTVRLRFTLAGITLGIATAPATARVGGGFQAAVDATGPRLLVGGRATMQVELLRGGAVSAHQSVPLELARPAVASVIGLGSLVAMLFIGAYGESILRTVRRGRRMRSGVVVATVLGGVLGVPLALAVGLVAGKEPGVLTLGLCVAMTGAAGLSAGQAAAALGRFRRLIAKNRRERRLSGAGA